MASLQDFIERGMAFFSGETVAKAELITAQAAHKAAVAELAQAQADIATSKQTISTLQAAVDKSGEILAAKSAEFVTLAKERDDLKSASASAAAKAAQIAAASGLPLEKAPAAAASTNENAREEAQTKYQALIKAGKSLEAGRFYSENKKLFLPET